MRARGDYDWGMTVTAAPKRMFINGDWADSSSGETTPVINPATEQEIARVPMGNEADVDKAVAAARGAFEEWSQTTPGERSKMLWDWAARIESANGFGRSGYGKDMGLYSIEDYTIVKHVMAKIS